MSFQYQKGWGQQGYKVEFKLKAEGAMQRNPHTSHQDPPFCHLYVFSLCVTLCNYLNPDREFWPAGCWDGSEVKALAAKPDDLSLIPTGRPLTSICAPWPWNECTHEINECINNIENLGKYLANNRPLLFKC